jgi:hypothetical protein
MHYFLVMTSRGRITPRLYKAAASYFHCLFSKKQGLFAVRLCALSFKATQPTLFVI